MNGAILVDGANLAHELVDRGTGGEPLRYDIVRFERAIRSRVLGFADFPHKVYYFNYRHDHDLLKLQGFRSILSIAGWRSVFNPCKLYPDGHFKDKRTDIAMVIDAWTLVNSGDIQAIAIVTQDSDFTVLFERMPKGISKYVVGWRSGMAHELREVAEPLYLDDFWNEVRR